MADADAPKSDKSDRRIGSYRLIAPLGTGGMSSVFRAVHIDSGHEVALKVLPRSLAKNPAMLQRFLREAKSAEALEHPNIVAIYDRGVDQGRHYLVLELVNGGDLQDRVRSEGPLQIDAAVDVIRSVAEGLKYAAERGLIHRDIKPANLLLSDDGKVKIIDLGLALRAEGEDERVTRDGTTVGTVDYMAPEQARDSRATSERSDIYSLGCTFYYLLLGKPPFAGGDIAEKLNRHCTQPAPDPCAERAAIPRYLGLLIRKMMAKKPENRFKDYNELIGALKSVPRVGPASGEHVAGASRERQEEGVGLSPIESGVAAGHAVAKGHGGDDVSPHGSSLDLVDLAEDDAAPPPPKLRPTTSSSPPRDHNRGERVQQKEREYVEEESDEGEGEYGLEPSAEDEGQDAGELLGEDDAGAGGGLDDDELVEGMTPGRPVAAPAPSLNPSTLKWIYIGLGATAAVLLIAVLVHMLIPKPQVVVATPAPEVNEPPIAPEPEPVAAVPPAVAPGGGAAQPAVPAPPPTPPTAPTAVAGATPGASTPTLTTPPMPGSTATPGAVTSTPAPAATPSSWVEPADPAPAQVAEPPIAAESDARFALPAWAKAPIPQNIPGNFQKVRRINDPGNPQERSSISVSFEQIGSGTTEVIDNGPLLEPDLRLHGDARLLRGVPGRRPIVRPDHLRTEVFRDQPAIFALDGKQLVLDGIDLIVDLQDLPREHSTLFWCRGGSLTLNNCTVTVLNPQNRPFSLIRALGDKSNVATVRIEKTFLRGSAMSMIELAGGGAEVAVIRSVFAGGGDPMIHSTGTSTAGERKVYLYRSILANRGPIVELSTPTGARPAPLTVRALGTTFARFRADNPESLIAFHDDVNGDVKDLVNWMGEQNVVAGWSDFASMGNGHTVKLAALAAAQAAWPGTDTQTEESPNPWPVPPDVNRVLPEQAQSLATKALSTLATVASPSPYIWEKTIEDFKRPELPNFESPIPNVVPGNPAIGFNPGFPPQGFNPNPFPMPGAPGAPVDPNAPPPIVVKELIFDISAKPWSGNLGLYLREQIKPGDARVRVRVSGTGRSLPFTPYVVPEGTSLEIIVETTRAAVGAPGFGAPGFGPPGFGPPQFGAPPGGVAPGGVPAVSTPPEWTPIRGATGDALLAAKGGDLVLTGVEMVRDGSARLKALLKVEDGHLVVNHCRLKAVGQAEPKGGNLITFRAVTTRPLPNRPWPFDKPYDKPLCRIIDSVVISSGDVITAELGRGIVALTECAVAAGGTAFSLFPAAVARSRFDADLWIENCTLAAEKTFVLLGPWPGSAPGPDRPWLVISRDSAYISAYKPVSKESVLLRVEPNSLAQGALFWVANNDAYELTNFTARADKPTQVNAHPDFYRHWTSFWGTNHFRNVSGSGKGGGSVILKDGAKLTPGNVSPGELALDPDKHPGRPAPLELGVDLRRLQVQPGPDRPVRPGGRR
jgi:serine/threonine-protein kinase